MYNYLNSRNLHRNRNDGDTLWWN